MGNWIIDHYDLGSATLQAAQFQPAFFATRSALTVPRQRGRGFTGDVVAVAECLYSLGSFSRGEGSVLYHAWRLRHRREHAHIFGAVWTRRQLLDVGVILVFLRRLFILGEADYEGLVYLTAVLGQGAGSEHQDAGDQSVDSHQCSP